MLTRKSSPPVAVLNNQLFCATKSDNGVECFDVVTEKWSLLPAKTNGALITQLITHRDCLYAVCIESIEKYDIKRGIWMEVTHTFLHTSEYVLTAWIKLSFRFRCATPVK